MVTRQRLAQSVAAVGAVGLVAQIFYPLWGVIGEAVCFAMLVPYLYYNLTGQLVRSR